MCLQTCEYCKQTFWNILFGRKLNENVMMVFGCTTLLLDENGMLLKVLQDFTGFFEDVEGLMPQ